MTRIDIGRHPQTNDDVGDIGGRVLKGIYSHADLSDLGLYQSLLIANHLEREGVRHILYGPSWRTSSALAILRHHLGEEKVEYVLEERLGERDFGSWTGHTFGDIHKNSPSVNKDMMMEEAVHWALMYSQDFPPLPEIQTISPGNSGQNRGETFPQTVNRAWGLADHIIKNYKDNVYLLTHKIFGTILFNVFFLFCKATRDEKYGMQTFRYDPNQYDWFDFDFGAIHSGKITGSKESGQIWFQTSCTNFKEHLAEIRFEIVPRKVAAPTVEHGVLLTNLRVIVNRSRPNSNTPLQSSPKTAP